ncbi:MAG: hypothetical protein LUQ70_00230 [Methanobacteriaceae archaeon]|nr:hypothetical protein [Methanobacteriaceae archaeon]
MEKEAVWIGICEIKTRTFISHVSKMQCYTNKGLIIPDMMSHGGGIIKRQLNKALLLALAIAVCTLPLSGAVDNLSTSQSSSASQVTNIDSTNSASVTKPEVNAVYKYKKTYKKKYKKSYKKYKKKYYYKKVYRNGKYRYVRATYTYRTTTSYRSTGSKGTGDCWTNSEILYNQMVKKGNRARIIQYATSMSSRHRSVQYYKNGKWVNYDYKGNGYAWRYYWTSNYVNGKVIKSC